MKFTRRDTATFFTSSLLIGLIVDMLMRQAIPGLNFLVLTVLWIAIMFFATVRKRDLKPQFFIFGALAVINAVLVYVRIEPVVQIWSIVITLVSLALMAGMLYAENFMQLTIFNRMTEYLTGVTRTVRAEAKNIFAIFFSTRKDSKRFQIGNGIVVAIILGLIFIGLFSSSDSIFQNQFSFLGDILNSIGSWLGQFNIGRIITTIFWASVSGALLLVLMGSETEVKPLKIASKKFYTRNDSTIILSTLCAIFSLFILIQIKYLFAGSSLPDNLSYAEYARRGYGELLLATMLATAVVYSTLAYVEDSIRAKVTTVLANVLVILNAIVVLSAWKRLSLYESAYGWTMTRFVARLGLICILLGTTLLLIWVNKKISAKQLFGYGWHAVAIVLTVAAVLNPIGIITEKNITERSVRSVSLDTEFLNRLSPDSYPALCKFAPTLKTSYLAEYKALKSTASPSTSTYYPPHQVNHGLSAHYVYTKNFKQLYSNCLK